MFVDRDNVDRAPALAEFLLSDEGRACRDPAAILAACVSRWPGLRHDEFERGFAIAQETLRADAAEHAAEANALDRLAERRA
jgi:hypothetical protein